tara:strand:- start:2561 stop:4204 length:1644 start_codon:yes stop_codon:yes gene_type:complete
MIKNKFYLPTILFIFFTLGFLIYKDYGFNIDEKFHRSSGFYWLIYLSDFFGLDQLKSLAESKFNNIEGFTLSPVEHFNKYGIIFDVPAALLEILFKFEKPLEYYRLRHFLVFIFHFVGAIFFYLLLQNRFKDENISIIGLIFLILTPRLFGDSFQNSKDIIFLSLYSISLFYYFNVLDNRKYLYIILFALFSALTTTIRIVAFFLPISFIFIYLIDFFSKSKRASIKTVVLYLFLYFVFLFIFWPLLWENTIQNFLSYFKILDDYFNSKVLFLGDYYYSNNLPYYYLIFWIYVSTPIFHLIFFSLGFTHYTYRLIKRFFNIKRAAPYNDLWRSVAENKDFLIFLNLTIFFLFFSYMNIKLYNSWRIAYFLYLFIIYFAVYIIYVLNLILKKKDFKLKNKIKFILIMFFILYSSYRIYLYHPYQSYYFNLFTTNKIKNSLEVDYTGLSGYSFLKSIAQKEKNKDQLKIGTASWYPLWRMTDLLEKDDKNRIKILSNDDRYKSDYIYSNRISDVDKKIDKKYNIPVNFKKVKEFIIDGAIIYEVYKKTE